MQVQWFVPLFLLGACAQNQPTPADTERAVALSRECLKEPEPPPLFERRFPDVNIVKVTLEYTLLPNHRVGPVEVKRSTGYEELDTAAVKAIKSWSCASAKPLRAPVRLQQTFTYRLNGTILDVQEREDWPPAKLSLQWAGPYSASTSARAAIGSIDIAKAQPKIEGVAPLDGTKDIKAKLGTNFGLSYVFDAPAPRTFVNHRVVWRFPEGGFVHGYSGNRVRTQIRDRSCRVGYQCIAGWTFDQEWELVPGKWTVELWVNDELALSRTFEVVR